MLTDGPVSDREGNLLAPINIWDECICPDVVDDIEMWVSPPTPIDATSWGSVKNRYAE